MARKKTVHKAKTVAKKKTVQKKKTVAKRPTKVASERKRGTLIIQADDIVAEKPAPPPLPRKYNLRVLPTPMSPFINADGSLRQPGQYEGVENACAQCPGKCCRVTVRVTAPDVIAFCETLSLPLDRCFTLVAGLHGHSFPVDQWPGTIEFALRKTAEDICYFLARIDGYDRCGVYSARPTPCRVYPLVWTSDVARGGPHRQLCPIPYGVTPAAEEQFLKDCEESIERLKIHEEVRREWIARSTPGERSLESMVAFVIPRAAELMGRPPSLVKAILDRTPPDEKLRQTIARVMKPAEPQPGTT